jgi:predicted regulator of Ras-like GTPase activity (Roadblock/LC7/MglB family)
MPEYRIDQIEEALRALHREVSGLQASVVVSLEGFVVAAHVPDGNGRRRPTGAADSPQVAAMAASLIALSDRVLAQLKRGAISRILIDGTEGGMIVVPAGRDAALTAMINSDAKLGLVMLALRRSAAQVSHILSPDS